MMKFCVCTLLLCLLTASAFSQQSTRHAFLWTKTSGMQDLGSLGTNSHAEAINSSGQVVGYYETVAGELRAFLWTSSDGMQDIGTLGGSASAAFAINDAGVIAGWSATASEDTHAFTWTASAACRMSGRSAPVRAWLRSTIPAPSPELF